MRALAFALALAAGLAATPALAVYQCGDTQDTCQCGKNNPYPCCSNGGNCTWYAWHSACCNWGVGLPGWGNANTWAQYASANASYAVKSYPVTSAVACNASGQYGHVAWVTGLSGASVNVREQNCWGNYGVRSATYVASSFTGGFIVRAGQVQCRPGDSQTQSCGNCGTQRRGCGNDGKWNAWGACGDQGACKPGDVQDTACGTCGAKQRTCSSSCQWGAYSACEGSDPTGEAARCDTGLAGACGVGAARCVGGDLTCEQTVQPSAEACDGVDNDCDGATDEPACFAQPGTFEAEQPGADQPKNIQLVGGCSTAAGLSPLLALAWLLRRRRR